MIQTNVAYWSDDDKPNICQPSAKFRILSLPDCKFEAFQLLCKNAAPKSNHRGVYCESVLCWRVQQEKWTSVASWLMKPTLDLSGVIYVSGVSQMFFVKHVDLIIGTQTHSMVRRTGVTWTDLGPSADQWWLCKQFDLQDCARLTQAAWCGCQVSLNQLCPTLVQDGHHPEFYTFTTRGSCLTDHLNSRESNV